MVKKNFTTALILSGLLGGLGIDRFYLGCVGTGILKLITFGGLGIWTLIDFIRLATGDKLCGGFDWGSAKHPYQSGGAFFNTDVMFITISLLLGTLVYLYYARPWIAKKYVIYQKVVAEEAAQHNLLNKKLNQEQQVPVQQQVAVQHNLLNKKLNQEQQVAVQQQAPVQQQVAVQQQAPVQQQNNSECQCQQCQCQQSQVQGHCECHSGFSPF